MRRFRRPVLLSIVGTLFVGLLIGSYVIGSLTAQPTRAALEEAQASIPVYASVEERVVDSRESYAGTVQAGSTADVGLPSGGSGVVVRQTVSAGSSVSGGTLLSVVSGLPYFVSEAPLPLYRDLMRGDTGDDVANLQNSLNSAGFGAGSSGKIDTKTLTAVSRLYKNAGFQFSPGQAIPFQQLISIEGLPRLVVASAAVGTEVGGEVTLAKVQLSDAFVSFTVDPVAAADLSVGDPFTVDDGSTEVAMTISSIGAYVPPDDGSDGGQIIQLVAQEPGAQDFKVGKLVTVRSEGLNEPSLAVPVIAVHEDSSGQYVLRKTQAKGAPDDRVAIEVIRNGDGWAAIAAGEVRVGDQVLVSR